MEPDHAIELLRASPFRPFVVFMTDGSTFVVNHPDQAMVVGETLYVAHDGRGVRCAMINITRIETTEVSPPATR